jgi:hypothetical protein
MDGASWQGKTSEKYLDHAHRLERLILAMIEVML